MAPVQKEKIKRLKNNDQNSLELIEFCRMKLNTELISIWINFCFDERIEAQTLSSSVIQRLEEIFFHPIDPTI